MNVSSVMTANPTCCTRETPLTEVAKMMVDCDCGQIPVVESQQDKRPVGVVTDRDIVVRMIAEGRDPCGATAGDCMSSDVKTVVESASLRDAVCLMEAEQIRRLPVVDSSGKLVGIVAIADLALAGKDQATAEIVKEVSQPN